MEGLEAWGGTSLYDAIHYGLGRIRDQPGRKAVVVFSDGADTTSSMKEQEVIDYARSVEATVYSIGHPWRVRPAGAQPARLPAPRGPGDGRTVLLPGQGRRTSIKIFTGISDELHNHYLLAYTPQRPPDGTWREIEIRLRERKDAEVRRAQGLLRGEAPTAARSDQPATERRRSVRAPRREGPRSGYRIAPSAPMAEISIDTGDGSRERFPLAKERVTIGRSRDSDIFLPDQWLSRHHAEILRKDASFFLHDLGSKNGTLLNGEPVHGDRRLRHGDVITLGEHVLTFSIEEAVRGGLAAPGGHPHLLGARAVRHQDQAHHRPRGAAAGRTACWSVLSQAAAVAARPSAAARPVRGRPRPALRGRARGARRHPAPGGHARRSRRSRPRAAAAASPSWPRSAAPSPAASWSAASPCCCPNLMEDAAFSTQDSILSTGIRSALCAPLWFTSASAEQDAVIGLVYLDSLAMTPPFTEEDARIVTALANVAAAKIENVRLLEESMEKRRLEEDMRMAAEIQRGLLPGGAPTVPGYGLVGLQPALPHAWAATTTTSPSGQGRLLLALGDVSGKGTGAALLMTVLRAAVRGHWAEARRWRRRWPASTARSARTSPPASTSRSSWPASIRPAAASTTSTPGTTRPSSSARTATVETLTEGGMVLGLFDSDALRRRAWPSCGPATRCSSSRTA